MRAAADDQRCGRTHVIDVRMGMDDRGRFRAVLLEPSTYLLEITAWIDDDGGARHLVDDDGTIAAQRPHRKGLDDHSAL
jgi:hypothetical protein